MPSHKKIAISKNGPYIVSGDIPLAFQTIRTNKKGESTYGVEGETLSAFAQYALCPCGESNMINN